MEPTFTLTLNADEAAIVERILHTFAETATGPVEDYHLVATASKFAWSLLEQATDNGVEFPEY